MKLLINLPVMWYTELKPIPKVPTLWGFFAFSLHCKFRIPSQSFSLKAPLLYDIRAGPWNLWYRTSSFFAILSGSVCICLQSMKNFTSVALASSAFWISSCKRKYNNSIIIKIQKNSKIAAKVIIYYCEYSQTPLVVLELGRHYLVHKILKVIIIIIKLYIGYAHSWLHD